MRKDQSLVARMAAGAGAALLAAGLIADTAAAEKAMSKEAGQVTEKMNRLGGKTLKELAGRRNDATVVLSPYGLGAALHLLMMGAQGNSKAEISLKTSLMPEGTKVFDEARKALQDAHKLVATESDKVQLTVASAVFVPESAKPTKNFVMKAQDVFNAPVQPLDFKSPKALETVNGWVKKATKEAIPRILEKLEHDSRFVLLNAVYFKGAWELAFDPKRTAKAPFTRADGSKLDVPMMSASFQVELAELGDLQAVWLPYGGKDVAMLVIAPRADGAPTLVADTLKSTAIDDLIAAARKEAKERRVHVRLPRFRSEGFLDITDALASQIGPALAADSDYSPINKGKRDRLQVVHRAVVEVNEVGTVAAAATAITSDRSLSVGPVFSADRPFAFAIVHRATQAVLFAGYVADPGDAPAAEPMR